MPWQLSSSSSWIACGAQFDCEIGMVRRSDSLARRLDCVLAPSKEKVLKRQGELRGKGLQDLESQLRKVSGFAFYNTSRYDFDKLLADAPHLAANLRNYIAGFGPNMREVLEKFDFDNTISKLNEAGLLFKVLSRHAFCCSLVGYCSGFLLPVSVRRL